MRKYLIPIVAASLCLALAGCSTPPTAGGPSAQSVWTQTLANKDYQKWQTAPGFEAQQPAKGPHGKAVQIFVDPTVVNTLGGTASSAWPTGSMIVKDAYDAAGTLESIEYMQKTDGGWYYASFGVDGKAAKEGVKVEPCQACHSTGSDSVKAFALPK